MLARGPSEEAAALSVVAILRLPFKDFDRLTYRDGNQIRTSGGRVVVADSQGQNKRQAWQAERKRRGLTPSATSSTARPGQRYPGSDRVKPPDSLRYRGQDYILKSYDLSELEAKQAAIDVELEGRKARTVKHRNAAGRERRAVYKSINIPAAELEPGPRAKRELRRSLTSQYGYGSEGRRWRVTGGPFGVGPEALEGPGFHFKTLISGRSVDYHVSPSGRIQPFTGRPAGRQSNGAPAMGHLEDLAALSLADFKERTKIGKRYGTGGGNRFARVLTRKPERVVMDVRTRTGADGIEETRAAEIKARAWRELRKAQGSPSSTSTRSSSSTRSSAGSTRSSSSAKKGAADERPTIKIGDYTRCQGRLPPRDERGRWTNTRGRK